MNRSLVLQRLCFKELRMLLPLVLMLAVIGSILQILMQLANPPDQNNLLQPLFVLALPGLFAAGVGALLVGQERDSRTLYWMASLPILKQDIIRVKFFAGIAGLAAVWLISLALLLVRNGMSSDWNRLVSDSDPDIAYGILYSVFVLLVSFATAWSFRSTFVGLLVLVGIATLYTVAMNVLSGSKPSDALVMLSLVMGSGIALTLGWYAALRTLSPMPPPKVASVALPVASAFDRSISDRWGIQSPSSALIWQFGAQNRTMLFGLTFLFFIALVALMIETINASPFRFNILPIVAMPAALISVCWLGVISFQGDNIGNRIRFLSDRGISPRSVWLTRHAILIGMLGASVVAVGCISFMCNFLLPSGPLLSWQFLFLVCIAWASSAWTIYSVCQWISQVLPSPVIAAIVAPVVGCLPFAYGAFAFDTLETPIWILVIVTLIPWMATFRMTRFWMDGRMGKRFWLEHASWLSLFVLLPALPFLSIYATYPSMPASELKAFSSSSRSLASTTTSPEELKLLTSKDPVASSGNAEEGMSEEIGIGGEAGDIDYVEPNMLPKGLTLAEERKLQLQFIEQQLDSISNGPSPTPLSHNVVGTRLMSEATLARARIQDEGPDDDLLDRYRVSILLMTRYIAGVRANPTLKAQLAADEYEAWLLREVQNEEAVTLMSKEVYTVAVAQLANKTSRNFARYRALVVDWGRTQADISGRPRTVLVQAHTLGGYLIPTGQSGTRLISGRHVSTVAWHMKQYLNASDDQAKSQTRKVLARDWNLSETNSNLTRTPSGFDGGRAVPWKYWHADWEKQAEALKVSE